MKINRTALAAAASVVAVVVAGTAALAANFGILTGAEDDATPRVLSTVTDEMFVDVPVQQVTGSTEAPLTLAYQVEGVGVVTLMRSGDGLSISSIDVDPQWDAAPMPATNGVAVRFTSSDQVFAFSATVIDGEVMVDVVDETPAPAPGSYDDDDSTGGSRSDDGDSHDDDEGSYDDD